MIQRDVTCVHAIIHDHRVGAPVNKLLDSHAEGGKPAIERSKQDRLLSSGRDGVKEVADRVKLGSLKCEWLLHQNMLSLLKGLERHRSV